MKTVKNTYLVQPIRVDNECQGNIGGNSRKGEEVCDEVGTQLGRPVAHSVVNSLMMTMMLRVSTL